MNRPLVQGIRIALFAVISMAPWVASATCSEFCEMYVVPPDGCGRLSAGEDHVFTVHGSPLRVVAGVGSVCCAPPHDEQPEGDCSTSFMALTPTLVGPVSGGAWVPDGPCAGATVMAWTAPLPDGAYQLILAGCPDGESRLDLTVVGGGDEPDGCAAIPGGPGGATGVAVLALLSGLIRRRRSDVGSRWRSRPPAHDARAPAGPPNDPQRTAPGAIQ